MARPWTPTPDPGTTTDTAAGATRPARRPARLDRPAVRAAVAVTVALLVGTAVSDASARALDGDGAVAANQLAAGSIALGDDDEGRTLVDLRDMTPGHPVEQCLTVSYTGTILPVDIGLRAAADGELAPYVLLRIEAGTGGGYGDCGAFVASRPVFDGTVASLAAAGEQPVGRLFHGDESVVFRFRFELADDDRAVGRTTGLDVIWEAVPA